MDNTNIEITNVIRSSQTEELARMIYRAFQKKHMNLWIHNKSEAQAIEFLKKGLNYNQAIYAVKNGEILGVVGLNTGGSRKFFSFNFHAFSSAFGPFGALWRYCKYKIELFFHMPLSKDTVKIDPIVVSENARGMGIGSKLLEAVYRYAVDNKKKSVVLEVVDTNPQAKKLYEKQGFVTIKTLNLGFLTEQAGFSKLYYMARAL